MLSRLLRFPRPRDLRALGILGMNQRNAEFVLPGNPRANYPRVDDKVQTKLICEKHGIPVPQTYAVIHWMGDIRKFGQLVGDRRDFVIKPSRGAEGRGIIVVVDRRDDIFITAGGTELTTEDLRYHLENALSGLYSLGGQPDKVIVEQRIVRHDVFDTIAVGGTPDVRIILYRRIPVMAMVRLPTRASRGKANLHQGAVAAAVDLATGITFGGVCENRAVTVHPDTKVAIAGVQLPQWHELMIASMRLADGLEMEYVGVDFVLDANLGPVVLEANARPGLAIQIANRHGLLSRLRFIEAEKIGMPDIEARMRWCSDCRASRM
ncbi:alpha-L-glutamate ligase-like protein [Humisphaera borealis]|uniref:Alpha-L-glutamate ligase-like protein n=1 Tax=Humisphaera borealis TaxID=2807512 RepID=A0A7M2WUI8_9BACT|nr:alpha-L-glutamate ligase-like protein [Humisphaera borealis]QOV89187.1 alpha-L-glutamate ligase-like protein [Humisphaera borealis]